MTAISHNTPREATAPWVLPGDYSLVLTVNDKSATQPITVKMDPRIKATSADLAEQFDFSKKLYDGRFKLEPIGKKFTALVEAVAKAKEQAGDQPVKQQLEAFTKKLEQFASPNRRPGSPLSLAVLSNTRQLFGQIQEVDFGTYAAGEESRRPGSLGRSRINPREVARFRRAGSFRR